MKPVKMEALHLSPRLSPAQGGMRVLALKKHVPLLDVAFSRSEATRWQAPLPIWVSEAALSVKHFVFINCKGLTLISMKWSMHIPWQFWNLGRFILLMNYWLYIGLAVEGERKGTEHLDLAGVQTRKPKALETHSPEGKKKSKGIMKLFGRSF